MSYDLNHFLQLNNEWRATPLVPQPRSLEGAPLTDTARKRAAMLEQKIGVRGKRVLEVGCGRGHFCQVLAEEYGCDAVGVDIVSYDEWAERPELDLRVHDIAADDNAPLGQFDVIVSFAVWEHIEHPYTALEATKYSLANGGSMFLYANLYRGPKASHRYRDVFFPWPHLLFTEDIWTEFYQHFGSSRQGPTWVNKLTYAHYLLYFDLLGFEVERVWTSKPWFDEQFYEQHLPVLGRYPRFDLAHDFIYAIVSVGTGATEAERIAELKGEVASLSAERDTLAARVKTMQESASWRLTRPLRRLRIRKFK